MFYLFDFYPRPPRGGRPREGLTGIHDLKISTHALREEGDQALALQPEVPRLISTHALREEGDAG